MFLDRAGLSSDGEEMSTRIYPSSALLCPPLPFLASRGVFASSLMQKLTSSFAIDVHGAQRAARYCSGSRMVPPSVPSVGKVERRPCYEGTICLVPVLSSPWFVTIKVGQQQSSVHMLRAELSASACSKLFPRMNLWLRIHGIPPRR
jgi:hypothetical protein